MGSVHYPVAYCPCIVHITCCTIWRGKTLHQTPFFQCQKHFPGVGVQFCRFVLDKNHIGPATIESHQGDIFKLDLSTQTGVPETVTPQLIEDAKSIFLNTRVWEKTCEYHTQQKKKFSDTGAIDVIHGAKVLN